MKWAWVDKYAEEPELEIRRYSITRLKHRITALTTRVAAVDLKLEDTRLRD